MYYFFGAGSNCKGALNLWGKDNIKAIIDNNTAKIGTLYEGVEIISFEQFLQSWRGEKVIITAYVNSDEIEKQLLGAGIDNYEVCPYVNAAVFEDWRGTSPLNYNFLKEYKDTHKGESCFVIGNGPSLKIEDLDKIASKNIVSFACNGIYKIFDDTKWRPTYYLIADGLIYDRIYADLPDDLTYFIRDFYGKAAKEKNINWYNAKCEKFYPGYPQFSTDLVEGIFVGRTVTYQMLQIAAYMGFTKIYLLGVDFSYGQHFYADQLGDAIGKGEIGNREEVEHAYISARKYAEQQGIKIYNATRGGALEVFERVNFDELFDKGM